MSERIGGDTPNGTTGNRPPTATRKRKSKPQLRMEREAREAAKAAAAQAGSTEAGAQAEQGAATRQTTRSATRRASAGGRPTTARRAAKTVAAAPKKAAATGELSTIVAGLWTCENAPPPRGTKWSLEGCARWLETAAIVLRLEYGLPGNIAVTMQPANA